MRPTIAVTASGATLIVAALIAGCVDDTGSTQQQGSDELSGTGEGVDCTIDGTVTIGTVLSLTEDAAFAGEYQREGLELAFSELNEEDGIDYELIVEDDQTDVGESISAFEKLIERDDARAIVGPTLSDMAFPAFEDAQDAGVPVIGVSTTAEGIPEIGDFIFRDSLPEEVALAASLPAADEALGLGDVAVLHDEQDEFTSSAYDTIMNVLDDEGINVTTDETFQTADTEFRSQLTKVAEDDPDTLVLSALPAATVPLVQQARELGIEAPIVGGNAFNSPVMIGNLEDAAEGLIVGGAWSSALDSVGNDEFIEAYTNTYDRPPDQFAAQAYTAGQILDEAIRADCDANRAAIQENLGGITDLDTVLGPLSLDEGGEVHHKPVVQIVQDGEFTLLADLDGA